MVYKSESNSKNQLSAYTTSTTTATTIYLLHYSTMMFNTVIISFSGCNFNQHYAIREVSLYFTKEGLYRHFFVNPSTPTETTTNWYTATVLGGISANEHIPGALPLIVIKQLIRSMAAGYDRIACHGNVAMKFLESLALSCPLYDLQDLGVCTSYPRTLHSSNCGYNHKSHRECFMSKLRFIVSQLPKDFNSNSINWYL